MIARQSSTTVVVLGPFLNTANVEQTALSIVSSSVWAFKGGASGSSVPFSGAATHLGKSHYKVTLPVSVVSGAVGSTVVLYSHPSGVNEPVKEQLQIMDADVYDAVFGTGYLKVNAMQVNSGTPQNVANFYSATIENSLSFLKVVRKMLAIIAGDTTNGGLYFRDDANAKDRLRYTLSGSERTKSYEDLT
jgi:hypothetical protein